MAGGLVALLDDVAVIAKLAAASLDDVAASAGRAGVKAAGVVIDDTAVTPRYVVGLSPARELPIIWKIAKGSLKNKLVFLLPAALLLSAFAPWAITPILMVGGAYLCFEATEKIYEALSGTHHDTAAETSTDPAEIETRQVAGAIRTDLILSAEIMAIALSELAGLGFAARAISLALVGIAITIGVYGIVALIVKMDDVGLHLAGRANPAVQALGRGMVSAMPVILRTLSIVGVAAMLWVGGQIVVHGLEVFHLTPIPHWVHAAAEGAAAAVGVLPGVVSWVVAAFCSARVGIVIGAVIVAVLHLLPRREKAR